MCLACDMANDDTSNHREMVKTMLQSFSMSLYECSPGFLYKVMAGKCGSSITAGRCDTASSEETAAVFGPSPYMQQGPPISGIIHSGGVLADAVLASQSAGDASATQHMLTDVSMHDVQNLS